jgi:hypothetical protein
MNVWLNQEQLQVLLLSIDLFTCLSRLIRATYFVLTFNPGSNGNNHEMNELQEITVEQGKDTADDDDAGGFKVKERSILQAKLTKLAIQIGYAGRTTVHYSS